MTQAAPQKIPAYVDGTLTPVEKLEVHRRGLRHPAVSVFVMHQGRTLLQQRALGKYHTPGQWANACCTHPHWGEDMATCAARRLDEELGINNLDLTLRGHIEYRADVGNGLIEHEMVTLYIAQGATQPVPNPDEVMDTVWLSRADLVARIAQTPEAFTPWLKIYVAQHGDLIFADQAMSHA